MGPRIAGVVWRADMKWDVLWMIQTNGNLNAVQCTCNTWYETRAEKKKKSDRATRHGAQRTEKGCDEKYRNRVLLTKRKKHRPLSATRYTGPHLYCQDCVLNASNETSIKYEMLTPMTSLLVRA